MKFITVKEDLKNLSDEEIRSILRKYPNGEYTSEVCRNCGAYWTNPNQSEPPLIKNVCKECFEEESN